jgi:hypothetical protein
MTNYCVLDVDNNQNECFPGCNTNADCTAYTGATCIAQTVGSVCGYSK